MDKIREEFEKEFAGENFEYQGMGGYYTDPIVQAKFEGFEKGYTKETEPLKWRWEDSELFVGSVLVAEVNFRQGYNPFKACSALDGTYQGYADENAAKKACEKLADAFLAKLRGEA